MAGTTFAAAPATATFTGIRYEGRSPPTAGFDAARHFENPVLPGYYPDPSIERVGEDKVVYFPHDSYYLDLDQMPISAGEVVNFDHPDSLETSLMVEHIKQLQRGEPADIPTYDFSTHSRRPETRHIEPRPISRPTKPPASTLSSDFQSCRHAR